jgi:DNA-binding HxlR family transcriptional regulator
LRDETLCYLGGVLKRDYQGQECSIARALEIVGERWTLLIIRDAFLGLRRFDEFQESLGVARNVLTDRLNRLVEEGILERVRYSERPERYEYHLTKKGRQLDVALAGLRQWGDTHLSKTPPRILRRRSDKKPVVAAFVPEGARTLEFRELELVPGRDRPPGTDAD